MSFERQFRLSSHCLALVGVAALQTTHQVSAAFVVAATASLLWSLWRGWTDRGFELPANGATAATLAALAAILVPVVTAGAPPIRAIAEFMLVLGAIKGLGPKQNRDWLQIYVLSFFQLVSASALTVEPVFAFLFLLYLLFAPWVLVLFCLRREVGGLGQPRRLVEESFVEPSLFQGIAAVTVLLFLSTLVIFVFFPRMGAGYFSSPLSSGSALTGFSDEVGLGEVTALKSDESVAMRVTPDPAGRLRGLPLYWRGAALDRFDGTRWRRGVQESRTAPRPEPSLFILGDAPSGAALVREEIILEPTDSNALFSIGRALEIRGRFGAILVDALDNHRSIGPIGVRTRYEVLASLRPRTDAPSRASREVPDVDPRILELARRLTDGISDPEGRAEAIFEHLQRGFSYTMEPGDPGEADPLARFLFETRRGHCEYFASAYAVLLRAAGVPSLVVNGYHGGEWNEYGGYYVVRQSDAHSWVEAWTGSVWRVFDPTPASLSPSQGRQGTLRAMLDAYRMRWYRYVINYNLSDQAEIAIRIRDGSRRFRDDVAGGFWKRGWAWLSRGLGSETGDGGSARPLLVVAAGVLAVGLLVATARRRRRRAATETASGRATTRYLELLRLLARRGLVKRPAETPDEFVRRVSPALDGARASVVRITELYQEARFSGQEPPAALPEIDRLLAELSERP